VESEALYEPSLIADAENLAGARVIVASAVPRHHGPVLKVLMKPGASARR